MLRRPLGHEHPVSEPLRVVQRPSARSAVCYVRAHTPELAQPQWSATTAYAGTIGCTVALRYRDCACTDTRRPGWAHVLRAFAAETVALVIVPTLDHLAPAGRVRDSMTFQIGQFGGQLHVVDPSEEPDPLLAPAVNDVPHV